METQKFQSEPWIYLFSKKTDRKESLKQKIVSFIRKKKICASLENYALSGLWRTLKII